MMISVRCLRHHFMADSELWAPSCGGPAGDAQPDLRIAEYRDVFDEPGFLH